jgi:hypothetical protein
MDNFDPKKLQKIDIKPGDIKTDIQLYSKMSSYTWGFVGLAVLSGVGLGYMLHKRVIVVRDNF